MKQKIFFALMLLSAALTANAYDFEVDGLYYSYDTYGVTIVASPDWYQFSDLEIPETVTYEDATYIVNGIGPGAFSNCVYLKSVIIPSTVYRIGEQAFAWSGLKSITIPSSVYEIYAEAFYGCFELTSVYFESICVGENMFGNCPNLTTIKVNEWNQNYDSRENCNAIIETKSG